MVELRNGQDYGDFAIFIWRLAELLEKGYSVEGLYKAYDDYNCGLNSSEISLTKEISTKNINKIKDALSVDSNYVKLDKLIHEWNENIASIIGVKCDTFEEFAEQVARVSSDWAKYKSAEIMQQQYAQQQAQSQQQQTFVDVNTFVNINYG